MIFMFCLLPILVALLAIVLQHREEKGSANFIVQLLGVTRVIFLVSGSAILMLSLSKFNYILDFSSSIFFDVLTFIAVPVQVCFSWIIIYWHPERGIVEYVYFMFIQFRSYHSYDNRNRIGEFFSSLVSLFALLLFLFSSVIFLNTKYRTEQIQIFERQVKSTAESENNFIIDVDEVLLKRNFELSKKEFVKPEDGQKIFFHIYKGYFSYPVLVQVEMK